MKSFGTAKKFDYHLSLLSYDRWGTNEKRNSLITRTSTLKIKKMFPVNSLKQQQLELHETISVMVTTSDLQAYMMR